MRNIALMPWSHQTYGAAFDPVHKSHLTTIIGDYGCPKRFQYDRMTAGDYGDRATSGAAALGNAAHEIIAEFLSTGVISDLLEHDVTERMRAWLRAQEPIEWYGDDAAAETRDRIAMVVGLMRRVWTRVHRVVALEAGFIVRVGGYWVSGHVDCLYEPVHHPGGIALCDWKSGAQKPHQLELDHGWEAGLYSAAVQRGHFIPRGVMTREALEAELIACAVAAGDGDVTPTYGVWPCEVHQVHLADYVPYTRAGNKRVKRPEDLAHYGLPEPGPVKYAAGALRGGAWMPVRLGAHDVPRLEARLRTLVGMVRLGRFFDRPGERCTRCAHRDPCLNDGYVNQSDKHLIALSKLKATSV